ncbi:MAG: FMN-binding protein [Candidatus Andersenbacteria bacterium]|nr:FMN-binding protein [Candidatus Andersenbacteria bacterium]
MKFRKYIQITTVLTAFFALVFIKNIFGGDQKAGTAIAPNPTVIASLPTSISQPVATSTPFPTPIPISTNNPVATPKSTLAPTPTPRASQYKDGTFTGTVADAFYGNVQIQVVVTGGKISQVNFLQYPNDQRTSQFINQQAMPILQSEAIAAQSEKVSGVSGASATSQAFEQSLASALQQARA